MAVCHPRVARDPFTSARASNCYSSIWDESSICAVCSLPHLPYECRADALKQSKPESQTARSQTTEYVPRSLPFESGSFSEFPLPSSPSDASSSHADEPLSAAANSEGMSSTLAKEDDENEAFNRLDSPKSLLPAFRYQPPVQRFNGKPDEGGYSFCKASLPTRARSCPSKNFLASAWSLGKPCRRLLYEEDQVSAESSHDFTCSELPEPEDQVKRRLIDSKYAIWVSDVTPARQLSLSEPCRRKSNRSFDLSDGDDALEEAVGPYGPFTLISHLKAKQQAVTLTPSPSRPRVTSITKRRAPKSLQRPALAERSKGSWRARVATVYPYSPPQSPREEYHEIPTTPASASSEHFSSTCNGRGMITPDSSKER